MPCPDAPPRFAFLSPCGGGNLGDAAIVDSLLHGLRRRAPGAQVVGFTLDPEDTVQRHGVEAHTLLGYSRPFYGMREPVGAGGGAPPGVERPGLLARAADRARRLPRWARRGVALPVNAARELRHLRRTRRALEGVAQVIVAGGGQLDELWGGPFGHPYALLRYALLARAAGARFVVASVGTGLLGPLGRCFVRQALARAAHRSYRDARSRELLRWAAARQDAVVPDLAYAYPLAPRPPPGGQPLAIGLCPMAFCRPGAWPGGDDARYQRHVQSFGALAGALLREGKRVVLFTTRPEPQPLADALLATGPLSSEERARLEVASPASVPALFDLLGRVHAVVSARLHGAMLAHVAHRPVLAVAHERKVRTLMEDTGQARHCLDIDGFDAPLGLDRLHALLAEGEAAQAEIVRAVAGFRQRVEAQYDTLFGPPRAGTVASDSAAVPARSPP